MLDPNDAAFRDVERRLDELLAEARPVLEAKGIKITDYSERNHHYKNQDLVWDIWLQHNWLHSFERARVTVRIAYDEFMRRDGLPMVQISRRSEVFQEGRPSRVSLKTERSIALSELENRQLSRIAAEEIATGINEIETAV